jgi:dihydrofolate reductase
MGGCKFLSSLKRKCYAKKKGDGAEEIKKLKVSPGKNIVLWGSISLAQSLMKASLIDEYHLRICPVIVGGGRPLFPTTESYINLKMTDFKKYDSGLLLLQYEPQSAQQLS